MEERQLRPKVFLKQGHQAVNFILVNHLKKNQIKQNIRKTLGNVLQKLSPLFITTSGLAQFSVEKAKSETVFIPIAKQSLAFSISLLAPAWWPSDVPRPRFSAQRLFPSNIIATCFGSLRRLSSSPIVPLQNS